MNKLWFTTLSFLILVLGCAKETVENKAEGKKLEYWADKPFTEDIVNELSKRVASLNESVEFDYVNYTDTAAYTSAVKQTIVTDAAPGMFTWWTGSSLADLAKEGLLEDLSSEWEYYVKDGVNRDLADAMTFEGKIYGAPQNSLNFAIVYNRELFEEYGVNVPATFEEFLEICRIFKSAGIIPIGQKDDSWAGFYWFQQLLASFDVNLYHGVSNGSISFEDPKVLQVFETWEDMLNKGYFSEPMHLQNDLNPSFARKEVAMMMEESYIVTGLSEEFKLVPGKQYDIFVLPNVSSNTDKMTVFYEVAPILVPKNSAQKETAKAVLRNYYKKEIAQYLTDERGLITSSAVDIKDKVLAKYVELGADTAKYQLVLRYYENTPVALRDIVLTELSRFVYRGSTAQDTTSTLQQAAEKYWN